MPLPDEFLEEVLDLIYEGEEGGSEEDIESNEWPEHDDVPEGVDPYDEETSEVPEEDKKFPSLKSHLKRIKKQ